MITPHTYLAFLSGHEHLSGHPDNGSFIPAGLPNAGLGEAQINHAVAAIAAKATGALLLPHDLAEAGRLTYADQMRLTEARAAQRATAEGHASWRLLVVHVHCDSGGHRDRLLFADHRSDWGKAAVAQMAAEPTTTEPYIQHVRTFEATPDKDPAMPSPEDWLARAYNCLTGAWSLAHTFAVLVELGNLNSKQHAPMWTQEGQARAADWLVRAVRRAMG